MSLINDALKRARETQPKTPTSGAPPLPPVESPARDGTGWILVAAVVLFLAATCLFIGPALFGHRTAPVAKVAEINTPPRAETSLVPVPQPADTAPEVPSATNTLPPPAINTNLPPAVPAEQPLKVQGIIFNPAHPLAIVNRRTYNVGDLVGDYQVKQILKTGVVFQRPDGSQKTLGIGE